MHLRLRPLVLLGPCLLLAVPCGALEAADNPAGIAKRKFPYRVHVIEDYETEIEKKWWLRGTPEEKNVPPSMSPALDNTRCCRATATKDFDRKMGDASKSYKAVIFNPVPGPPMGDHTRLSFRYWLAGTDQIRVQIYSLSNGYHRRLLLKNLPQKEWQAMTVDMTRLRRPDGSGGPLSADERIDDIQFYISPDAELLIDDIVLYDAGRDGEKRPFPRRPIFTGWFDTGKQGQEWPGDFAIVPHQKPLTWDAARSVPGDPQTGHPWIRVSLRGLRPLGKQTRLRLRYHLTGADSFAVELANSKTGETWTDPVRQAKQDAWSETTRTFSTAAGKFADEIRFRLPAKEAQLQVDDLLLYEP